jgi:asparagine synthase (glutamine-hydrolysing)
MASAGLRPKTFSIGFGERDFDELRYAREIARRYGTDHHEEVVQPDAAQLLPTILWHLDEPFADASAVPTYTVASLARKHLKVVLSGDGGDELFAGYLWLRRARTVDRMGVLPEGLRRALARRVRGFGRGASILEKVGRIAQDSLAPPEEGFLRRISSWTDALKRRCYGPDLTRAATASHRDLLALLEDGPADFGSRMLYADTKRYLPDDCLVKVDRMTMAHGLEARVPFVDHRVAEFAARLPFSWKLRGMTTKYILKLAMRPYLPEVTTRQRKRGFSLPVDAWIRGPLAPHVTRLIRSSTFRSRGLFSREGIEELLASHESRREELGQQLWALLCFEIWCRIYLDGPPPETAPAVSLADLG